MTYSCQSWHAVFAHRAATHRGTTQPHRLRHDVRKGFAVSSLAGRAGRARFITLGTIRSRARGADTASFSISPMIRAAREAIVRVPYRSDQSESAPGKLKNATPRQQESCVVLLRVPAMATMPTSGCPINQPHSPSALFDGPVRRNSETCNRSEITRTFFSYPLAACNVSCALRATGRSSWAATGKAVRIDERAASWTISYGFWDPGPICGCPHYDGAEEPGEHPADQIGVGYIQGLH